MPAVVVNTWLLKDNSPDTVTALQSARDILKTADGFQGTWAGTADEDPNRFFSFIVWETVEHQNAFRKQPSFPGMLEQARSTQANDVRRVNVEFINDFIPALSAPTTEILQMTLKEGATKEKLYKILEAIAARVNEGNERYKPVTWGPTVEDPNKFYLTIGWDSMKAHVVFVGDAYFQPLLADLRSTADLEMFHVSLNKET